LTILSEEDVQAIHGASMAILGDVGVNLPNREVLDRLLESGAEVDLEQQVARFPEQLVEGSLEKTGKQFTLHGREPDQTARFGYGDFVLVSSPGQFAWVDRDGDPRREPTSSDVRDSCLVGDGLAHIDIVGGMGMPVDIPVEYRDVWMAAELVKGTTKPTHVWVANGRTLGYILQIYEAVSGGREAHRQRPMIAGFVEPVSPLRHMETGLEILVTCAQYGLPVIIGPIVQAGATGPVTLAGTLALENAEILAAITLAQVLAPGIPVCYGGVPHIMDMRSSQISFGSPEQGMMAVAMTQMAHSYRLPAYINVGLSDSKRLDPQSGLERGMSLLMGALAGADTFGHMGILGADQAASLEQLVVDDEMASYIKRILQGFGVGGESLAVDVVREVGIGGSFLSHRHTRDHFRHEMWFPMLSDRRRWDEWWNDGARTIADAADERRNQILNEHAVEPMAEDLTREIDEIVTAARIALSE
jgi:trimethylamine--corrinoid protein Co-methyltransferase